MTDRELLEAAARAAGYTDCYYARLHEHWMVAREDGKHVPWNPLTDDGDALRLAVRLRIAVNPCCKVTIATLPGLNTKPSTVEETDNDPYAATRRAIVRAAAAMAPATAPAP